jgi:peptide deformylase
MTELEQKIEQPLVLFNPEIVSKKGKTTYDEGCLSVPSYYETVERFDEIEVKALDIDGKPIRFTTDGLLAICIQHEIDHLDGKLFIDRLSPIKSARIKSKIKKFGYPDPTSGHPETEEELEKAENNRL